MQGSGCNRGEIKGDVDIGSTAGLTQRRGLKHSKGMSLGSCSYLLEEHQVAKGDKQENGNDNHRHVAQDGLRSRHVASPGEGRVPVGSVGRSALEQDSRPTVASSRPGLDSHDERTNEWR